MRRQPVGLHGGVGGWSCKGWMDGGLLCLSIAPTDTGFFPTSVGEGNQCHEMGKVCCPCPRGINHVRMLMFAVQVCRSSPIDHLHR